MRSLLLTLLLASSLSVGCAILEDEQTTTDTGGVTTSPAPASPAAEESTFGPGNFMTAGLDHNCALRADSGDLECWGGDEGQSQAPTNPNEPNYLGSGVRSVSAGYYHTCAIKADDMLVCWGVEPGSSYYGQTNVPADLGKVKSVAAGTYHTCVIKADDSLRCWGSDEFQQVSGVPFDLGSVKSVVAHDHTCVIKADDEVACWGNATGVTAELDKTHPPADLGKVKSIAAGTEHTCAIKADDTLECWGDRWHGLNIRGILMYENGDLRGFDGVKIDLGSGLKSVNVGRDHGCVIKADDTVACWGDNGITPGDGIVVPPIDLGEVKSIHSSDYHNCARKTDDTIVCWGGAYNQGPGLTPTWTVLNN